jgi:AraC family transcriptional regulator
MRVNEAFQRLNELVTAAGLSNRDTKLIGIYHDDPSTTPEDKLRSDAAITVPAKTKLPPGLSEVVIPAGRYAHTTYVGPYTGLGDVWRYLTNQWPSQSGERLSGGMSYEIYRNTPIKAKPDELATDIYLALK